MNVRPTVYQDLEDIFIRENDLKWVGIALAHFDAMPDKELHLRRWARTLEHEGTILAIGGVTPGQTGRCEVWTMLTAEVLESFSALKALHRGIRETLDSMELDGMERIQAYVSADLPHAIRWIENFGFEFEGRMRKALPDGTDALLYARVN